MGMGIVRDPGRGFCSQQSTLAVVLFFIGPLNCHICGSELGRLNVASHIQVFDNHRHRFPFRTNCKGNSTWAYCVLAFRFLSEYVAIIMLHRERQFPGALDNR